MQVLYSTLTLPQMKLGSHQNTSKPRGVPRVIGSVFSLSNYGLLCWHNSHHLFGGQSVEFMCSLWLAKYGILLMFDGFNTAKKKNKQLNKHGIYIYMIPCLMLNILVMYSPCVQHLFFFWLAFSTFSHLALAVTERRCHRHTSPRPRCACRPHALGCQADRI